MIYVFNLLALIFIIISSYTCYDFILIVWYTGKKVEKLKIEKKRNEKKINVISPLKNLYLFSGIEEKNIYM